MSTFLLALLACNSKQHFGSADPTDLSGEVDPNSPHPSCAEDEGVILSTPSQGDYEDYVQWGFTRYTTVVAPNGGVIPIFAQDQVTETQLRRARSLLRFFLTDSTNCRWGTDKSSVANSMVENGAVLMMLGKIITPST